MPEVVQDASWNRINNIGNLGNGISRAVDLYNMFKPGGTEDQRRQMMQIAQQQSDQAKQLNQTNIGDINSQIVYRNTGMLPQIQAQTAGLTQQQKRDQEEFLRKPEIFGGRVGSANNFAIPPNENPQSTPTQSPSQLSDNSAVQPLAPIGQDATQPTGKPSNPDSSSTPPTSTPDQSQQSPGTTSTSVDAAPKAHKPVVLPTDSTGSNASQQPEIQEANTSTPPEGVAPLPGTNQSYNTTGPTGAKTVQVAPPVSSNSTVSQGQVVPNQQSPAPVQGTATPPLSQPNPGLLPVGGTQQTQQTQPTSQGFPPLSQVPQGVQMPTLFHAQWGDLSPNTQAQYHAMLNQNIQKMFPGTPETSPEQDMNFYSQRMNSMNFHPTNPVATPEVAEHYGGFPGYHPSDYIDPTTGKFDTAKAIAAKSDYLARLQQSGGGNFNPQTQRRVTDYSSPTLSRIESIPDKDQEVPGLHGVTKGNFDEARPAIDQYRSQQDVFRKEVYPSMLALKNLRNSVEKNNFNDMDMIKMYAKITNPNAVVRDKSVEMDLENAGVPNWVVRKFMSTIGQGGLSAKDRLDILNSAGETYKGQKQSLDDFGYKTLYSASKTMGADPKELTPIIFGQDKVEFDDSKLGDYTKNDKDSASNSESKTLLPPGYKVGKDKDGSVHAYAPDGTKEPIEKYSINNVKSTSQKPVAPQKNNSVNAVEG